MIVICLGLSVHGSDYDRNSLRTKNDRVLPGAKKELIRREEIVGSRNGSLKVQQVVRFSSLCKVPVVNYPISVSSKCRILCSRRWLYQVSTTYDWEPI